MQCPNCQFENREEAIFCRSCGASLVSDISCPNCEASNPPDSKFCEKCGLNLKSSVANPPLKYSEPQSYTPKFLADKIFKTRSSMAGERKMVTVFFADVANFTSISEKLDPEEVHQIMDGCFKILMDEIHRFEGTINQFTGDGVMALFGAPVAYEDHAQRACHAALFIQKAIEKYSEKLKKDRGVDFKMRVGINSGLVIVGSIGDDLRMDYTAVGDTTNLASRMEGMAIPGNILVARETFKLAGDFFEFESFGKVELKGKEKPVEAYRLLKAGEVETRIGASVAKGLTRFVGRKRSMTTLREALEETKAGSGQVVGIVGEAGVGKSRILYEFKNMLPQNEYAYFEGRCRHFGGSMSYLPFLDILRSYFDIKEGDQGFIIKKKMADKIAELDEKLENALPPLMELFSLKIEDQDFIKLEPQQKRERTFEAIRNLLIRMSQERPFVLAVEDLHWIDKTSEELLNYLIGSLASTHFLLVLLYRPEYTHQWGNKSYYHKIGLNQLTVKSSGELVQALLEEGKVSLEIREFILNRTSGNPLYMEELTHSLLENGSIQKKDHKFVLSATASDIQIPDTIQGIIAARMDRLEDNLKRTMQVASVIGRDFAFRILQTITSLREGLKAYLLDLQGLEFIYEKSLFPELEYIFKHALTREVAYNSLLRKRRKDIHAKIGKAIEQIYSERLDEFYETLAYHYSKSGVTEKAYQYLKLAGDKATNNHSSWEAFKFYKEAFDVLKKKPKTEGNQKEQLEILHLLLGPMMIIGYPKNSIQILKEGEQLSKEIGDEKSLAIFYSRMGRYFALREGKPLLGLEYSEKSFQEAEKIQDIELMIRTGWDLCPSYTVAGQWSKVADLAPKVISLLEETKREHESFGSPLNIYCGIQAYYGVSLGWLGDFEGGKDLLDKGLRFASEINDILLTGWIEFVYGQFFIVKGEGAFAIKHFRSSITHFEETKFLVTLGLAWTFLGAGYYLMSESETAIKHIEKGRKIQSDAGIEWWLSLHYLYFSVAQYGLGDQRSALNFIKKALKLSQKNGEKHIEGLSWIWLGRIFGSTDSQHIAKAEKNIRKGIKILRKLKLKPGHAQGYLFLGELYTYTNQRGRALENLKKAEALFQEMSMDYFLATTQKILAEL